jgi:hypothetical protein
MVSEMTDESSTKSFTGKGRVRGKFKGWTCEGIDLHNGG